MSIRTAEATPSHAADPRHGHRARVAGGLFALVSSLVGCGTTVHGTGSPANPANNAASSASANPSANQASLDYAADLVHTTAAGYDVQIRNAYAAVNEALNGDYHSGGTIELHDNNTGILDGCQVTGFVQPPVTSPSAQPELYAYNMTVRYNNVQSCEQVDMGDIAYDVSVTYTHFVGKTALGQQGGPAPSVVYSLDVSRPEAVSDIRGWTVTASGVDDKGQVWKDEFTPSGVPSPGATLIKNLNQLNAVLDQGSTMIEDAMPASAPGTAAYLVPVLQTYADNPLGR